MLYRAAAPLHARQAPSFPRVTFPIMARKRREVAHRDAIDAPPKTSYATISHTLPLDLTEHLRAFAHYQRVSASAVIEYALVGLFRTRDDAQLGAMLRRRGAGPRRKPKGR